MTKAPILSVRGRDRTVSSMLLMGVVNASPDSFSDAHSSATLEQLFAQCARLVDEGADIIDVGGQSAITNRPEVDAEHEAGLVLPIVEWLNNHHPEVLISVDTYKPMVVDAVLGAGASIINDVSGLLNPEVARSCARHQAGLVIMHTAAKPKVRLQRQDLYVDVVKEVAAFLEERLKLAEAHGLAREAVILDPGPDFTKTPHQTVTLLRGVDEIRALGRPILLALSRKDFLGAITGRSPRGRDAATHAALAYFAATPGYLARVHDVRAARDVVSTIEMLTGTTELDPAYLLPDHIRHEPPLG